MDSRNPDLDLDTLTPEDRKRLESFGKPPKRHRALRKDRRMGFHRKLANRGLRDVLGDIEAASGGRKKLLEVMAALPLDEVLTPKVAALKEWVNTYSHQHLAVGLADNGISYKTFMELYREAVLAPAKLQAEIYLAAGLPNVMSKMVTEASEVWSECKWCHGVGVFEPEQCLECPEDPKKCQKCSGTGQTKRSICPVCSGHGQIEQKINMESRRLSLEASGLVGKGRELTVAIQNNVGSVPSFEDSVKKIPKVIDTRVLSKDS